MAKSNATPKMDTPTARAKNCKPRHAPYWEVLEEGLSLGYRHGKRGGTWFAKYYLPKFQPSRKQKDLGPADDGDAPDHLTTLSYSQAKEEAKAWFKTEVKKLTKPEKVAGPYTVRQCMDEYKTSYNKDGLLPTKDTHRVIDAHILPKFAETLVANLTYDMIQKWFENLASTPARIRSTRGGEQQFKKLPDEFEAKRRRRSTANRILTVLKAALNRAVECQRVDCPINAWKMVKPFRKADSARLRFLSIEDQKTLVDACPPDFQKLVQAALYTGARYGELAYLMHVRDFNEKTGQVYVTAEAKSNVSRYITLTDEGIAFFKSQVEGRKKSERMFTTTSGADWKKGHQIRPMKAAVKAAEIEDGLSFHELRHTYASTLIMAGIPLTVVADQLGHIGTRMVDKHYGHLAKNYVAETIRTKSPRLNLHASDTPKQ